MEESGWGNHGSAPLRINDVSRPGGSAKCRYDFIADAVKQIGTNDAEISRLQWFSLDDLPPMDQIAFDHSEDLVLYKKYLLSPHPLPLLG
jgi:hypothetical protein